MYVHSREEDNATRYLALDQMTDNPFHIWEDHSKDSSMSTLARGILSNEQFYIDLILLFIIFTLQLINICAIIANSLNIAVFVKLGFSEPSNISLTALAICDFISAVLLTWTILGFLLTYHNVRLPFHSTNVSIRTGGIQWVFLSRTVAWITAFISFERCLCILVPLKVRRLITPRVVEMRKISSWRMSVTSDKSQWVRPEGRPAASSSVAEPRISQKEKRLVRMVVAIATIFIVSYIPTCVLLVCDIVFDEFNENLISASQALRLTRASVAALKVVKGGPADLWAALQSTVPPMFPPSILPGWGNESAEMKLTINNDFTRA
ncbi:chemosensory receptor b [Plakobranchus ocellatus]|uniref:Chemosensory receptor b n=1 Tax=Plakobranchus ocellatus TaxID=259542 RepID=A0AAV4E257_9GAST|nr:chemosensory receptor b [Plakobranchus ocellatus]